eukprot:scaffold10104_cov130-Isochrysis_galbana.AAC.3
MRRAKQSKSREAAIAARARMLVSLTPTTTAGLYGATATPCYMHGHADGAINAATDRRSSPSRHSRKPQTYSIYSARVVRVEARQEARGDGGPDEPELSAVEAATLSPSRAPMNEAP